MLRPVSYIPGYGGHVPGLADKCQLRTTIIDAHNRLAPPPYPLRVRTEPVSTDHTPTQLAHPYREPRYPHRTSYWRPNDHDLDALSEYEKASSDTIPRVGLPVLRSRLDHASTVTSILKYQTRLSFPSSKWPP